MADWDADDFKPEVAKPDVIPKGSGRDKWDGEDDDDGDIRDNWDDDDEEEKVDKSTGDATKAVQVAKKKRPLKERIAEKEEQARKEREEKQKLKEEEQEARKTMTPKEQFEEKLRLQKIQEQADLDIAMATMGLGKDCSKNAGVIDSFEPSTKEDFDKFSELLATKITKYEKSTHYEQFLESLYQKLALGLEAESIKKLSSMLTALSNEKTKQLRGVKSKKKNQKASLVVGKDTQTLHDDGAVYDEFDDYL